MAKQSRFSEARLLRRFAPRNDGLAQNINVIKRNESMNTRRHLFTSESVAEGHPDKIADQISDAILDAFLAEEPEAKVACETFVADNLVVIAGEFKTVRKELFSE